MASFFGIDLDTHVAILILRNNCDWPDSVGMDLMERLEQVIPDAESWGSHPQPAEGADSY